jgi:hypothetical protein
LPMITGFNLVNCHRKQPNVKKEVFVAMDTGIQHP